MRTGRPVVLVIMAGRYPVRMTNTARDWRSHPPTGLKVVAYQRDCGWHVIVSATGPSVASQLRPRLLGKACVPLYVKPDETTVKDQLRAIIIGTDLILHGEKSDCNAL